MQAKLSTTKCCLFFYICYTLYMKIKPEKKYLIDMRDAMMKQLLEEGYTGEDIGQIFNLNRSVVWSVKHDKTKRSERK
jgi:hypothetical protein